MTPVEVAAHIPPVVQMKGVAGTSITVGNILQTLVVFLTGGSLAALLKLGVMFKKQQDESRLNMRKLESEEDASLRTDLMKRIADLEKGAVDERRACDEKIRALQTSSDDKIKSMQAQIDGLMRQLLTMQLASGQPIQFPPATNAAAQRLTDMIKDVE